MSEPTKAVFLSDASQNAEAEYQLGRETLARMLSQKTVDGRQRTVQP